MARMSGTSTLKVTVDRETLMDRVAQNRDAHRSTFEEALEAYRSRAISELEKRIDSIRRGKKIDVYIRLPEPEDHTEDYERVLDMLAMHNEPEIVISNDDFARFVRDDWDWKEQWTTTNAYYLGSSNGDSPEEDE